jgi:hypothetical protein
MIGRNAIHEQGAEPSKDLEDRVRFGVNRVVLDQNNAGQLACAGQVLFDYRLTDRRLLRGETKNTRWIAPYYESHPGVAQIADPVEQMSGSRTRTSIASGLKGTAPGSRPPYRRLSMLEMLLATLFGAMRCMSVSSKVGPLFASPAERPSGLGSTCSVPLRRVARSAGKKEN